MPLFARSCLLLVVFAAFGLLSACAPAPTAGTQAGSSPAPQTHTLTAPPAPTRTLPAQINPRSWPASQLSSFHASFSFSAEPMDSASRASTAHYEVGYAADRLHAYAFFTPQISGLRSFYSYFMDGQRFTFDWNTRACPSVPSALPPFDPDPAVFTAGLINPRWLLTGFSGLELEQRGEQLFNIPRTDRYHFSNARTTYLAWDGIRISGTLWLDPNTGGIAAYQASSVALFDIDGNGQPQTARLTWNYQLSGLNMPILELPPAECFIPGPEPLTADNWFENFPLPEGAQLATFNNSGITALVPDMTIEDLAAFYRAALSAQGWLVTTDTVTPSTVTTGSAILVARQDSLTVEIRFSPAANGGLDLIIMPGK